jgi:hypothetical protein
MLNFSSLQTDAPQLMIITMMAASFCRALHTLIIQTLGGSVSAAQWKTNIDSLCNPRKGIWYNIPFSFAILNDEVKPLKSDRPVNKMAIGLASCQNPLQSSVVCDNCEDLRLQVVHFSKA